MRTFTILNHDTGVEAAITVEATPGGERVSSVVFTAHGERGVEASDLLVLPHLGLPLPAVKPVVVEQATGAKPPPKAAPSKAATSVKQPGKLLGPVTAKGKPRVRDSYRPGPGDDELLDVFLRSGRSVAAVARFYNVPPHTGQSWIKRLRRHGRLDLDNNPITQSSAGPSGPAGLTTEGE